MLSEAFGLLVLGMGGVFTFLALLVFLMFCSAKFFTAFAHLFPEKTATIPASSGGGDNEKIAVALVAIKAKM